MENVLTNSVLLNKVTFWKTSNSMTNVRTAQYRYLDLTIKYVFLVIYLSGGLVPFNSPI